MPRSWTTEEIQTYLKARGPPKQTQSLARSHTHNHAHAHTRTRRPSNRSLTQQQSRGASIYNDLHADCSEKSQPSRQTTSTSVVNHPVHAPEREFNSWRWWNDYNPPLNRSQRYERGCSTERRGYREAKSMRQHVDEEAEAVGQREWAAEERRQARRHEREQMERSERAQERMRKVREMKKRGHEREWGEQIMGNGDKWERFWKGGRW